MKSLFPSQLSNQIILVMGEHAASNWMWELSAWLALQGNLRVLDAGNRFNAYPVAQAIRRQQQNPRVVLERIRLSRAFTCYQVDVLLEECQPLPYPTLVFDLLSTFYDENVNLPESQRLLRQVIWRLQQLSKIAPVVVSTRLPASICAERMVLYDMLKAQVGELRLETELTPEDRAPLPAQLPLLASSDNTTTRYKVR
jgi:hypothetical protein